MHLPEFKWTRTRNHPLITKHRVAVVGARNAGKTTWVAMLSKSATDQQGALVFDQQALEYCRSLLEFHERGLPIPANGMELPKTLNSTLLSESHRYQVQFQDYPGALNNLTSLDVHEELRDHMRQFLLSADSILIFLDLSQAEPELAERSREIHAALSLILMSDGNTTRIARPVALVITKWDRFTDLPANSGRDDGDQELQKVRCVINQKPGGDQLLQLLDSLGACVAVFPVSSLGPGSTNGVPSPGSNPYRILSPLHWCAQQAERLKCEELASKVSAAVNNGSGWLGYDRGVAIVNEFCRERGVTSTHPHCAACTQLKQENTRTSRRIKLRMALRGGILTSVLMVSGWSIASVRAHQNLTSAIRSCRAFIESHPQPENAQLVLNFIDSQEKQYPGVKNLLQPDVTEVETRLDQFQAIQRCELVKRDLEGVEKNAPANDIRDRIREAEDFINAHPVFAATLQSGLDSARAKLRDSLATEAADENLKRDEVALGEFQLRVVQSTVDRAKLDLELRNFLVRRPAWSSKINPLINNNQQHRVDESIRQVHALPPLDFNKARSILSELSGLSLTESQSNELRKCLMWSEARRDDELLSEITHAMAKPSPDRLFVLQTANKIMATPEASVRLLDEARKLKEKNTALWEKELWDHVVQSGRRGNDVATIEATRSHIITYLSSECPLKTHAERAKAWQGWYESLTREQDLTVTIVSCRIPSGSYMRSWGEQRPAVTLELNGQSGMVCVEHGQGGALDQDILINKSIALKNVRPLHSRPTLTLKCQKSAGTEYPHSVPVNPLDFNSAIVICCKYGRVHTVKLSCDKLAAPKLED